MDHEARTREQTAVAELGRYALDERSLQDIFDKTAELVARALQVPFCTVNELLPGGARLSVRAGVGWREGTVGPAEVDNWRGKSPRRRSPDRRGTTAHRRRPGGLRGNAPCLEPAAGHPRRRAARSAWSSTATASASAPCARSRPSRDRFGRQDALFLQTVADLLSAVIESERHKAASREVQARYERIAANTPGMVYQAIRHPDGTGCATSPSSARAAGSSTAWNRRNSAPGRS